MAGVGKTVLLNSVYQHFKRDPSFDQVVTVVITKHPDLRRIQDNLAYQLNLQLNEQESTSLRAKLLLEKVNEDEKVLILLDDLWDKMDLAQVGIPCKNCKIVFTTRSLTVCQLMKARRIFEVDVLSEEDSLRLLKSNTGDALHPTMAQHIVKECKGVPLAIIILGRALRGKCIQSWTYAFERMENLRTTRMDIAPPFLAVEVSYDFLRSEKTKMCFLLCSLFPEDYKIPCDTLLSYVVGESLLPNGDTLEESRSKLNAIIAELSSLGFLLKLDQDCVMMHDIVRDVALGIGFSGCNRFLVKAGMGLTEWPFMSFDTCVRLSLMHNKLKGGGESGIPAQVNAPQLSTLSLRGNKDLKEIPDDFFENMKGLLTLDLSETCIVSLPHSLSCLVNLRTLCLDRCYHLSNITPIKKLGKLEILTLSQNQMQQLPKEISMLVSLKLLDLSKSPNLVILPPGVISSFSRLEELNMRDSFSQWEVEDFENRRNATLSEVATLKHLTCLRLCVENLECLSEDMLQHWGSLKKFEILFGSIVSSS